MADLSTIVSRLEPRLGVVAGAPVPLDGGITNRNYRVRFGERDCVLRLPGKDTGLLGIDRQAERVANEAAAALGIAPTVAAGDDECLVTEFLAGGPVDADGLRSAPQQVGAALRRFHDCGLQLPVRFWVPELLDEYAVIVRERGGRLPGSYAQAREFYGPTRRQDDAPVRIAQRGGCMRECTGGGAFAETIIGTLFGYAAKPGGKPALMDAGVRRGFRGELHHVRYGSELFCIRSGESGVGLSKEA